MRCVAAGQRFFRRRDENGRVLRHQFADWGGRVDFLWPVFSEKIQKRELSMKSFRKLLKAILAAIACAIAIVPSSLLACAACTGKTDSPLAVGMNWGIVTLLGFVLTVLSCFVVFFI